MNKTITNGVIILIFFVGSISLSQNTADSSSTQNAEKENLIIKMLEQSLTNNFEDYSNFNLDWNSKIIDSLKSIRELLAFYNFNSAQINRLNFIQEKLDHQYQKNLLLKISCEHFKNQPDYDLGVISEYLGVSNRVAAIILAILSL